MDFLSIVDAKLLACSIWMPNIDSLEIIDDLFEAGTYQIQNCDQLWCLNTGLYVLKPTQKY